MQKRVSYVTVDDYTDKHSIIMELQDDDGEQVVTLYVDGNPVMQIGSETFLDSVAELFGEAEHYPFIEEEDSL